MIEFPPLTEHDVSLVAGWLRRDHVAVWWREPVEEGRGLLELVLHLV